MHLNLKKGGTEIIILIPNNRFWCWVLRLLFQYHLLLFIPFAYTPADIFWSTTSTNPFVILYNNKQILLFALFRLTNNTASMREIAGLFNSVLWAYCTAQEKRTKTIKLSCLPIKNKHLHFSTAFQKFTVIVSIQSNYTSHHTELTIDNLPLWEGDFWGERDLVLVALQGNIVAKVVGLPIHLDALMQVLLLSTHAWRDQTPD